MEVVALRLQAFAELLARSPLTEDAIGELVLLRLEENRAADRRRKGKVR